jgi:very-short-patch-repair endonuclease
MNKQFPEPWDWSDLDIPEVSRRAWEEACGHYIARQYARLWECPDDDWRLILAERHRALSDVYNGAGMESPLEQKLVSWLLWLDGEYFGLIEPCRLPWFDEGYEFDREEFGFSFMPQVKVSGYRVDFMVLIRHRGGVRRLAIECDGHDYHEKTKEQAQRDKKRDRDLLLAGVQTIRFTGSELFRDPGICFDHIQEQVSKLVWEVVEP